MFGLTMQEVNPDMEIWPDNLEAVQCFIGLSTQWKSGMNGVNGLDYAAISIVMEMNDVTNKRMVFGELQIMEREVLRLIRITRLD